MQGRVCQPGCVRAADSRPDARAGGNRAFRFLRGHSSLDAEKPAAFESAASNYAAYRNIERQVSSAKSRQTRSVYFDQGAFNSNYCYFNAFSSAYHYDLQKYYHLDKRNDLTLLRKTEIEGIIFPF